MGITERKVCDNMRLIDADAIEYTHAVARNLFDGHNWNELVVTKDEIEDMPTIQPEITHEQAVAYLQSTGWMQEHDRQMMLDGVHRLTAQPEPHWIPVKELPIPDEEYVVTWTSEIQEKPILSIICGIVGNCKCLGIGT